MDNRPIGVFDSGLGGLTVVKALSAAMPNEQIVYSEGNGAELLQVDANRISSWTTGDLSFVNEPLEHIVKVLERRFNVQIVIEDPELSSEVFTCHSEDSAGIDQILKLLQQTRMLKYQRNKNQIIISNY